MINKVTKVAAIVALAGVSIAGLSACAAEKKADTATASASSSAVTPSNSDTAAPTTTPGVTVVAPVVTSMTALNGTTQTIVVGQSIDINVTDEDPSVWSGVSSDPTVATVSEGSKTATVTTNPGVSGVKAGTATVTFTNSFTKEVVTFTVTVA